MSNSAASVAAAAAAAAAVALVPPLVTELYWINVDSCTDRAESMRDEIARNLGDTSSVRTHRVSAVTPEDLEGARVRLRSPAHQATAGEIACCLSHLETIALAHDRGLSHAVVCEDDVHFEVCNIDFNAIFQAADKHDATWDIVQFFTSNPRIIGELRRALVAGKRFVPFTINTWGTCIYAISRRGMRKLLHAYAFPSPTSPTGRGWDMSTYCFANTRPVADLVLYHNPEHGIRTYTYTCPFVTTKPSLGSLIHPAHVSGIHARALDAHRMHFPANTVARIVPTTSSSVSPPPALATQTDE